MISFSIFFTINFFFLIFKCEGTNAMCERLFSQIEYFWNDKKSQITIETVKSWLAVKHNISMTCLEFAEYISKQEDILKQIGSNEKYNFND